MALLRMALRDFVIVQDPAQLPLLRDAGPLPVPRHPHIHKIDRYPGGQRPRLGRHAGLYPGLAVLR